MTKTCNNNNTKTRRSFSKTTNNNDKGNSSPSATTNTTRIESFSGFDTIALHGGYKPDTSAIYGLGYGAPRGVPVYRTAPYQFQDTEQARKLFALEEMGNIYSRITNPTTHVLEARYCMLEGAHPFAGVPTASGTNAIFYAIGAVASVGDNIVASSALYGGTFTMFHDLLPNMGITVKFVDSTDPAAFVEAADEKTRAVFIESVSNPSLQIFDIEAIANHAHEIGLPLIVDSTFSTPALCKPLDFGADIVVTSLTKWVGGHGAGLGGMIVDGGKFNWAGGKHPLFDIPDTSYGGLRWGHDLPEPLQPLALKLRATTVLLRNLGGCISPDNSWIILQGIETLSLRMERHCDNSLAVAKYLSNHPKVSWVKYPGLPNDPNYELTKKYLMATGGPMVAFGIIQSDEDSSSSSFTKNNQIAAGAKFIEALQLFSHVANVGDAKSLAIHPASTTHSQLNDEQLKSAGVSKDMVRLSIGIESIEDILTDLDQALAKV